MDSSSKEIASEYTYKEKQEKQVDTNFVAFEKVLPEIIENHEGKFALMRDGNIKGYFHQRRCERGG